MAKRHYGSGSLFQRGDTWWAKIYVDGEPVQKSSGSKKRADAQRFLDKLIGERHRGEIAVKVKSKDTIASALDTYISASAGRLAKRTFANYQAQSETYLKPFFGSMPVRQLTAQKIIDYRDKRSTDLVNQGNTAKPTTKRKAARLVSQTTINRELSLLRAALWELKTVSPGAMGDMPHFRITKEDNARQGFMTDEEFEQTLLPVLPMHLQALTACGFYCGGRAGEWLRADWEDVDFDNGLIYFPKTKNKHPREVPIVEGLMRDLLLEHKKRHEVLWPDCPAVFTWDGKRLTTFKTAWNTAIEKAKLPSLRFHDLRRSSNKSMRDRNVPQGVRMKIMGHLTPSMDLRYGIVDRTDIDIAREKMKR
jgi:integrase